ncbi:chaperonin 10-like protein [Dactylonectria macrodidyma]|uniref:Chaperonin 10-like protein n=1 Tax=Dactylonectria macrodidyma TaxID=307937 RepID=A0A9P9FL88_9HYPO|nr:chaperonin 10-like protein [Dactylonectria macrodidyma]
MATQSGITIDGPNKPYTVVSDIPRPSPGPGQVLVECLGVGINPVEPLQQHSGLLINEWPAIIGSDCAAVVTAVGPDCTKLSTGDYVYGCAPLGQNRFTPFQDTFLVDERVFFKKSSNLSVEDTCTIGVGLLTAGLCLLGGADLKLSEDGSKASEKDEWIVVLGGTGSVGQFAVQIAHVCGYKVLTSCSPSKKSVALENGATATFNNRGSVGEQLAEIKKITGGNFARIVDSTAYGYEIMVKALETCSTATTKYLTTVDDWSEFNTPSSIKEYRAELGHLCRLDEELGTQVTNDIAGWIPTFETHLAVGTLKPIQYQVADGMGWDSVIQGIQDLEGGKALKKIVVRVQKE